MTGATTPEPNLLEIKQQRAAHAGQFLRVKSRPNEVLEVRGLKMQGRKRTDSGYFDNLDTAAECAIRADVHQNPAGMYVTLNPVKSALLSRAANRIKEWAEQTTADDHIDWRLWLFIDIDPERVAGVSATDAEHEAARDRANAVREWLMTEFGWHAPFIIDSGNGFYLLFPIDLPNDADSLKLVERILAAIGERWSDAVVKIDSTVANAARIMRLPGTTNRKGDSTPDRPHRLCKMIDLPDYLERGWAEPIPREKLDAVAALAPAETKTAKKTLSSGSSDYVGTPRRLMVDKWLTDKGVTFEKKEKSDRVVYVIDCTNPEHRGEANITQFNSGALTAGCFHDHCASKDWEHFRDTIGKPDGQHWDPPFEPKPKKKRKKRAPKNEREAVAALCGFDDDGNEREIEDPWTSIELDEGRTDAAFSRRFLRDYGENVHWVPAWKSWLVWDGCRWKIDEGGCAVTRFAQAVSDSIWHEVAECPSDDAVDFAQDMSKPSKWSSALKAAAAVRAIAVADLNVNRWLIPCPNGTVDLRTGELRPHRKEDLLTTLCPTEFHPDAQSYNWDRFLDGAIPSQPVQDYLQRLCGYALSGRTEKAEELLPVLHGGGSNGKSKFIEAIRETVGSDFAGPASHGLLTEKQNDRHATERASLYGKRFVFCSETGHGAALDEDLIKSLTGGDCITARYCHKDPFSFVPSFTIFLITNHKPKVRGTDNGIWRRLNLIPWQQRFWLEWRGESGPPELKADPSMPEKLAAERSGILAWMVRGCLAWQQDGLKAPSEVQLATAEYRTAEDMIGQFVAQCCITMPSLRVRFNDLYARFEEWCEGNGERPPKGRTVGQWLQEHGHQAVQSNGRWYIGIALEA